MVEARESKRVERRSFYRSPELHGVELLEATRSTGPWRVVNVQFALAIPEDWSAAVNHDGRKVELQSGQALMLRPGEVHSTTGSRLPGTVRVMIFSDGAFEEHFGEHMAEPGEPNWLSSLSTCSPELVARFAQFFRIVHATPTRLQLQSAMTELGAVLVPELVAKMRPPRPESRGAAHAARMREVIHDSTDGMTMDLNQLASAVGMNRFQALRAFKKRYGLPPHAYQLVARVQHSMALLRRGVRATDVALQLGFADHSHFTRHFKRIVGLTPHDYAQAGHARPFALPKLATTFSDGLTYSYA